MLSLTALVVADVVVVVVVVVVQYSSKGIHYCRC